MTNSQRRERMLTCNTCLKKLTTPSPSFSNIHLLNVIRAFFMRPSLLWRHQQMGWYQSLDSSPHIADVLAREPAILWLDGSLWAGRAAAVEWWSVGREDFNCQWTNAVSGLATSHWSMRRYKFLTHKSGAKLPVKSFSTPADLAS